VEISPLYEQLIYLEDKRVVTADELRSVNPARFAGVIGKMEVMGLVERQQQDGVKNYRLSEHGYRFLNSVLDTIHSSTLHWDRKWRLLWSSVPEKNRRTRDKLRKALEGLGLRPALRSLWVTPLDLKDRLIETVEQLEIQEQTVIVEAEEGTGISTAALVKAWDFNKCRSLYEDFITQSDQLIHDREQRESPNEIKKLIFQYALILNNEPRLPIELLPKDWPKFRAQLQYKKLRRLLR